MDGSYNSAFDGFDEVWNRVCGKAEAAEPGLDQLRKFISDEACASAYYEAASRKFPVYSQRLRQLAAEERCHLKQLQGEHFLMTGEVYPPPGSCPLPRGGLCALRSAYCDELQAANAYRAAAEAESVPALRGLYLKNASDEERHAGILKELILRSL